MLRLSMVWKAFLPERLIILLLSSSRLQKLPVPAKIASLLHLFRSPVSRLAVMQAKRRWKLSSIHLGVWSLFGNPLRPTRALKLSAADFSWTAKIPLPGMLFVMPLARCIRKTLPIFRWNQEKSNTVTAWFLAIRFIRKYLIVSTEIGQH